MEINFTTMIEKGLNSIAKGTKWTRIANLYAKYSIQINFAIVYLIGFLLYFFTAPLFASGFSIFGSAISLFIAGAWTYVMTVGSFGYMWGFKPKPIIKKKVKAVKQSNQTAETPA
jgi:hypothetical protein